MEKDSSDTVKLQRILPLIFSPETQGYSPIPVSMNFKF